MRILRLCAIATMLLGATTVAFAAEAASVGAEMPEAPAPPAPVVIPDPVTPIRLGPLGEVGRIQGSHLHINLHLEIAEVFEVLARMRAIPPELVEPVLAESRAASEGGEPASYIRVEAHIRLSEVAPLLAAITGPHRVRVEARVEAEPQAEVEPQPAPCEGPPPNE